MKIADVKSFIVGNPPPHFGGRYFIFIKITTDNGLIGYGEVYSPPFHPKAVEAMIEDVGERILIGADPFRIESLAKIFFGRGYLARPDATMSSVFSGVEMALWDIKGKALGVPIYELMGGKVREHLRGYTYIYPDETDKNALVYSDPDLAATRALDYVKKGFTAIKFDPVGPYTSLDPRHLTMDEYEQSVKFVMRLREAVGNEADLLFGTHGQMTPASAIRLANLIEPAKPLWLEEPTAAEKPEEMALIAKSSPVPIATGERLVGKYEFARVIEQRAAAILQPALGRVGGIWEARKIAAMAEAHYISIAPHLYAGPIAGAANIQLAASVPNFLILECIEEFGGFHAKLLKQPIKMEEGYVQIPVEPGLGVELDEDVALAHPYEGDALHLDMHPPLYHQ